jgi:hypothetical protein
MNVIICQNNGQRLEGTLLAAGKYCLRVAVPGAADITELHREYGQWALETGEPVELESADCRIGARLEHLRAGNVLLGRRRRQNLLTNYISST